MANVQPAPAAPARLARPRLRLEGRVAVVTGAGRGIGAAIARRFAEEGAIVAVLEFDRDTAERTAADLPNALAFPVDVTNFEAMQTIISQVHEQTGRLDILVNNAGITRDKSLKNMGFDEWDAVIRTNLTGVWNGCRTALPYLVQAGPRGRVISLSSVSYLGNFGQINYAASKAGVVGLTRSLALEVARAGVTVNAIAPGFTDTDMTRAMPREAYDHAVANVPMRRAGQPEDVANLAAFLASDDASYITGQVMFVDGGFTIGASHA